MSLEIDPDTAKKRINEFLEQIEELLEKNYAEGKDEKRSMGTKLDNFAEVAFTDGEKKKDSLHPSAVAASFGGRSERKKQKDYEDSLKRKKRHLEAWKEQIELEKDDYSEPDKHTDEYNEIQTLLSDIRERLPIYADDLETSLSELKSGHHLASVLITGRVIDHTIDQIKSSQHLGGPEEVLEHLEENGIIDSTEGQITESVKSYRDIYTHEIGKKPDYSETLIILLGCTKLLQKIQESQKTREYDLA